MAGEERAEVEVSGLTDDVDNDFLQLYFENRRSGGGAIESLSRNGPLAIITFTNPRDAARVLAKGEHCLHHVTVEVRRPPPWDPRKVALCGFHAETGDDLLQLYVEAVSECDNVTIVRSADKTNVLLTFQQELTDHDFTHLLSRVEEKKLQNHAISAHRVRATADILVGNIGTPMSVELLEMYFENKRSGGGEVRAVTVLREDAAIISFKDWTVVDRVLSKAHMLQNRQLSVSHYYPELLGSPSNGCAPERTMEGPASTPSDSCTTGGVVAVGGVSLDVPEEDDEMVVSHDGEEGDAGCGGSGVTPISHGAPRIQADTSAEPASPRTPPPPHTDEGARPLDISASCAEVEVTSGGALTSIHEAEVLMDKAELLFMQRYHHDLLAGMTAVTIVPLEENRRFGFKVVGDAFSCRTAVEVLQHVVSSLSSRAVTLDYPYVSHVLLESEGQRTLRDIEEQHHCVIDTSRISWRVLDYLYPDPWSFIYGDVAAETSPVQSMMTDDVPYNPLQHVDVAGIKRFASIVSNEGEPKDSTSTEATPTVAGGDSEDMGEDLYTDVSTENDPTTSAGKDDGMDQVCLMPSPDYQDHRLALDYQDHRLDEEAQLMLAIQRSMDSQGVSFQEEEEFQRALALSLLQQQSEDPEESFQRAVEMSLQEQTSHGSGEPMRKEQTSHGSGEPMRKEQTSHGSGEPMRIYQEPMRIYQEPMRIYQEPIRTCPEPRFFAESEAPSDSAQIRVLAGDETSMVVASAALRKAITSKLHTVSMEGVEGLQNIAQILDALQRKHKVKISKHGRELQIQGFLQGPNKCRQELNDMVNALQARERAEAELINMDVDTDVEMTDLPDTSEDYQRVVHDFLQTLQDQTIEVLQVQKVHNALLYNQYQLKKLRMVMTDPNIPVERILYHGTTEISAREICHNGFNRSFCGKNAAIYGQGVYFAVESEVSTRDTYSPPNKEGKKFVFVARVLSGEFALGREHLKTPPLNPHSKSRIPHRYHSLVNSLKNPTFFVIFNDTQAYPEYLITCTKRKDPPAK